MVDVEFTPFGSRPAVIHAQGHHTNKPFWQPIRDEFFSAAPSKQLLPPELTIITCNNGHPAMGCFERGLGHLGLHCVVLGGGINPWINSRDKPRAIAEAARWIKTEYIFYADSRDALLIQPPAVVLDRFVNHFSCDLLFGGDRLSYPPNPEWAKHERMMAGGIASEFIYLNAGAWIGRTSFVAEFFAAACNTAVYPSASTSEQGIIRGLLPNFYGRVRIDCTCAIFLNIGFLFAPQVLVHKPDASNNPHAPV
jgi:hypothetical protein